jgi:hypothetical protein
LARADRGGGRGGPRDDWQLARDTITPRDARQHFTHRVYDAAE